MNILVTGGAGFVGSALVDRLLAEDHHVTVLDDLSTGTLDNLAGARREADRRLRIQTADIAGEAGADLVARCDPEVVVHLASDTDRRDGASLARATATTLVGTLQVLDGARRAGARKVVVAGSARARAGRSVRAMARVAALELVDRHRTLHGLECTTIVLPTVFGPRQRPGREASVVATLVDRLVHGKPCVVHGDGEQSRDLLYVDDAVDALVKAIDRADGLQVDVGTGVQTSIASLCRGVAAVLGVDAEVVSGKPRADEPGAVPIDPSRARMYLGWSSFTPLAEGLTDTVVSVAP